ncbi:DUF6690 family protein [Aeoliella mucimassa]|nr:DUF6690 family protein [Aeoliella mucimassa]
MLAGLLGAAVGVPYVVDQADTWNVAPQAATAPGEPQLSAPVAAPAITVSDVAMPNSPGDQFYVSRAPLEGLPTYSLAEVLRIDVNKEWVYHRWARKSTGLSDVDLFGIRVPLVSGTRMTDVAGSLTYYFNRTGQADKIRLVGKTADTTELVNLLVQRYGFRPAPPRVAGEQLYQVRENNQVLSELRTWPESVLWATSPHDSFSLELEINRPGSGRYVKYPLPQLAAVEKPATSPPPPGLLGEEAKGPPQPVLPAESVVPSTENGTASSNAAKSSAPKDASAPKKQPVPQLRWPS